MREIIACSHKFHIQHGFHQAFPELLPEFCPAPGLAFEYNLSAGGGFFLNWRRVLKNR
jgi:hypothetical protein